MVKQGTARYPWLYLLRGEVFKLLLYRVILPCADRIFVQSEQMKKDVVAMGIAEEKLTAVPMGVPLEQIPYQADGTPSQEGKTEMMVVYLGTLIRPRRIDFLIRVFEKVLRQVPNARLYLVGGGDDPADEQMLIDEAVRLGVGHAVVFTGFLPM